MGGWQGPTGNQACNKNHSLIKPCNNTMCIKIICEQRFFEQGLYHKFITSLIVNVDCLMYRYNAGTGTGIFRTIIHIRMQPRRHVGSLEVI